MPIIPPTKQFGRGLIPECLTSPPLAQSIQVVGPGGLVLPQSQTQICGVAIINEKPFLSNEIEAFKTVNNESSLNQLLIVSSETERISFVPTDQLSPWGNDNAKFVLLSDAQISNNTDFSASTIALNTQCKPVSVACNLTSTEPKAYVVESLFNCSDTFYGSIEARASPPGWQFPQYWSMTFFNNASSPNITFNTTSFAVVPTDVSDGATSGVSPVYMVMMANLQTGIGFDQESALHVDAEIVMSPYGDAAFILLCNTTAYAANYSWINGAVAQVSLSPANQTITQLINIPMSLNSDTNNSLGPNTIGLTQLVNGAIVAGFSNTSQDLADKLALVYSQTALGFAVGSFIPRANIEEQTRESLLVARVPVAALYSLIILDLIYAAVGVVMAIFALRATSGSHGTSVIIIIIIIIIVIYLYLVYLVLEV